MNHDVSLTHSRWWHAAIWTLRLSVAVQCLGNARLALKYNTAVFSVLWSQPDVGGFGWSEASAQRVDHIAAVALVAAALFVLIRPCWPVLVPVAVWQLLLALAAWWKGGIFLSELALPGQAARIVVPLGLMLLDPWPRRGALSMRRVAAAMGMLRLALAVTFVSHGIEALLLHPTFLDYLLLTGKRLLGLEMDQTTAQWVLRLIGAVDLALACLLVGRRWRWVALYMAFWGAATAASRIVYAGVDSYDQTLQRAVHGGAPLAIGLYWTMLARAEAHRNSPTRESQKDDPSEAHEPPSISD